MKFKLIALFIIITGLSVTVKANMIQLTEHHIKEKQIEIYIVRKGDTLWDISAHLLNSPELWPTLWSNLLQDRVNSKEKTQSPDLIYPGDILKLTWINGKPTLTHKPNIKLSPTFAIKKKQKPIPTIPLKNIASFLSKDQIINSALIKETPRLVNSDHHLSHFIEGDTFYAEGLYNKNKLYGLYRLGTIYKDLETGKQLGTELIFIGYSKVSRSENKEESGITNKVTAHDLIKSVQEARQGDLILPIPEHKPRPNYFIPQPVSNKIKGHILAALNNAVAFGKYDVVVIDKGIKDDIKIGSLFSILKVEPTETLIHINKKEHKDLTTPEQYVGELMVFKTYQQTSIAIILHAKETIWANYKIEGSLKDN